MTIKRTSSVNTSQRTSTPKPAKTTKPEPQKQQLDTKDQFGKGCWGKPKVMDAGQTRPRVGVSRDLSARAPRQNTLAQTAPQAGPQAQIGAQAQTAPQAGPQAQVGAPTQTAPQAAPQAQVAPQAQTAPQAAPQAQTAPAGNETELGGTALSTLTQENPNLRTNQDLINHCYQQGGGSWAGAQEVARGLGADLNTLVQDRQGSINTGAAAPAQPNAPAAPAAPAQPNAPAAPAAPAQPNAPAAPAQPNAPAAPAQPNAPAGQVDATAATDGMSEAQRFDHYRGLIEQNGGQFKTGPNERNILSLRTETDADVNGGQGRYDDKTVMLWTDSNGRQHVREYESNTEPSARYRGRMGVDANGDGRLDQGRLPAGYYEYRTGHSNSLGRVLRPTQSTNAERDTNHDGLFNDGAMASAGRSMLFHAGGNNMTGSAGCQTMSPAEYNRFWSDLNNGGNPGNIGYTLINL